MVAHRRNPVIWSGVYEIREAVEISGRGNNSMYTGLEAEQALWKGTCPCGWKLEINLEKDRQAVKSGSDCLESLPSLPDDFWLLSLWGWLCLPSAASGLHQLLSALQDYEKLRLLQSVLSDTHLSWSVSEPVVKSHV